MPGALGVEQEQCAEDEQQRRGLQLRPNLVGGQVAAVDARPAAELAPKHGQDVLAQHEVQAPA